MIISYALTINSHGNGDRSAPHLPSHLEVSGRPENVMDGTCHVCHSDLARVEQNVNRGA